MFKSRYQKAVEVVDEEIGRCVNNIAIAQNEISNTSDATTAAYHKEKLMVNLHQLEVLKIVKARFLEEI